MSTSKENPVAASCNTCNSSMESDPDNKRLANHLRVNHKPLHSEFEEAMRKRGLSLVNENVPAVPKTPSLRNFRKSKRVSPVKEDGKKKLNGLFQALLKQAKNIDDGQPQENKSTGVIEKSVGQLINHLVSGTIDTETFHEGLQKVLKSQPQPALIPFINQMKSQTVLRHFRIAKKKRPETRESGKVRLKNLFEALLRQAKKADGQEDDTVGIIENAVGQVINNLISGSIDTETFHQDLQKVLNSGPQPALIPFINDNLQSLKNSLTSGELSIAGRGGETKKAAKPVAAVRPTVKVVAKPKALGQPIRAPYALRNVSVSAPKPRIIATPCSISQKSKRGRPRKEKHVPKFDGVCLLALTGTHDCSVDHDKENVPPQEQMANEGNDDAKPTSLRDIRINRNKSKGTFLGIRVFLLKRTSIRFVPYCWAKELPPCCVNLPSGS